MSFSSKLIHWYEQNKRELPWRNTKNPYKIWLSEVILQQTRVGQGLPYYEKFITKYPTINDLASADEQEVLLLWQGLGYYSRGRNLLVTAQQIAQEHQGVFPKNATDLQQLKGIGTYTAAAIASFAFNQQIAVVDGNVYRVLSRFYGIFTKINTNTGKNEFQKLANDILPKNKSDIHNQAIMEFGALQCTPKKPHCQVCILSDLCYAHKHNLVNQLPQKNKKSKVQNRNFQYIILLDTNQNTLIYKRTADDIWKNLYEFPLIETEDLDIFFQKIESEYKHLSIKSITKLNSKPIIHKLTHQKLEINFWLVKHTTTIPKHINIRQLGYYPFPIVIKKMIEKQFTYK
ncbi:MAG: A/G-specific adenine glycosylase [Bacteroidota bacterium]|nr:A/G-specific adenine glycosylase [Bacteroidota bacterium]